MNRYVEPLPNHPAQFHRDLIEHGKRYAYSYTKNWHDAEDLAQQAWLKLKTKYNEVKDKALLFRAIRNLFIDGARRSKIVAFDPLENAYHVGKPETQGARHDIEEALSVLSPAERDSIVLNVVKGDTAEEITRKTGMPRGTVLSHIHRGRRKLLEKFGGEFRGVDSRETLKKAS